MKNIWLENYTLAFGSGEPIKLDWIEAKHDPYKNIIITWPSSIDIWNLPINGVKI